MTITTEPVNNVTAESANNVTAGSAGNVNTEGASNVNTEGASNVSTEGTSNVSTPAYWQRPPVRLRRLAVLRVLLRPRAAARLLQGLADDAATYRLGCHVLIRTCARVHYER